MGAAEHAEGLLDYRDRLRALPRGAQRKLPFTEHRSLASVTGARNEFVGADSTAADQYLSMARRGFSI